ncbi:MAG TPA: excinuclease ABC subunit UvrC [Syntrophales bacterium]|nr:excinuclease ABC subunit UvrC [Syntrophales bacterium]
MNEGLFNKIQNAPRTPGVYLMKDKEGGVLYVGKSKDLRSRINAYFSGTDSRCMIPFLVSRIHDVDFILTETEKESLILENHLIKKYRPKYNVDFRDDKAYFHVRIDGKAVFPRYQLVRRPQKDGAYYFGPYPSSAAAKETLTFLQSIFPLRTCSDNELKNRKRPCVEYQIKRCCAPCLGMIDGESYRKLVMESIGFLEGREKKLIRRLKEKMDQAADALNFEEAAALRDRMAAVQETIEKQVVASRVSKDQDVWGLYEEGGRTQVCILHVRGGKLLGKRSFSLDAVPVPAEEMLSSLIRQYYDGKPSAPPWILLPMNLEDRLAIEEWLREKRGGRVRIYAPRRGSRFELLTMAVKNAAQALRADLNAKQDLSENLAVLKEEFHLAKMPARMECFDISHMSGRHPVASMVTFLDGKPWKKGYRHFKIRTVEGIDDYAMMYEVLKRRYTKGEPPPDLLVVDGGRGQLGVALSVLRDLGVREQDVVGIAKERNEFNPGGVSKEEDRFYLPGRKDPVYLTRKPRALGIMQHIRDEAHRFAVTFFRRTKGKEDFHSILDDIPGIGAKRKMALLRAFGDLGGIKSATVDAIAGVEGIGSRQARVIHDFLRSNTANV